MKHIIVFFLVLVLCPGMVTFMNAREKAKYKKETGHEQAARKSHQYLKKLPPHFIEMLGFKSKKEARRSTLGEPLEVYMMGLKDLKKFKPGDDPKKILVDTKKVVYPVYVGDTLISSLTVIKKGDRWEHAALGEKEIHFTVPARIKHSTTSEMNTSSYFMVRVPAMYLNFLGFYRENKLYLVPSHDHPDFTFDLYKPILAGKIYIKMQALIDKYQNVLIPPSPKKRR